MTIDAPALQHTPGLKALWKQAFGDPDFFIDSFFRNAFSPTRSNCLYENGQLAAALYWFDCAWQEKKVAYIYAVATDEAFRGHGFCRALMENTHHRLSTLGYAGSVLVPAKPELFALYQKLGYLPFCPMENQTVLAGNTPENVTQISPEDYTARRQSAVQDAVLLQPEAYPFLESYNRFYQSGDSLFCAGMDEDTLYFQEYLGDPDKLPGILRALDAKNGKVRLPGGAPFAMYRSFSPDTAMPAYFNIPLD